MQLGLQKQVWHRLRVPQTQPPASITCKTGLLGDSERLSCQAALIRKANQKELTPEMFFY